MKLKPNLETVKLLKKKPSQRVIVGVSIVVGVILLVFILDTLFNHKDSVEITVSDQDNISFTAPESTPAPAQETIAPEPTEESPPADDNDTVEASSETSDAGLSPTVLKKLKAATVFIKVKQNSQMASGSGFLIIKRGQYGYIITNAHVILIQKNTPAKQIAVVFNSGETTERTYNASVVTFDDDRDIALLKISSDNLPASLDEKDIPVIRETTPVYIFGFPFGAGLSLIENGNPAITVSTGTVSSIRKDEYGDVSLIQITGDINPGNSGGPIVDKTGKIVGIAVAKVSGTQIGLAIPIKSLQGFFDGRASAIKMIENENAGGTARITFSIDLIDPLQKIKKVGLLMVDAASVEKPFPRTPDGYPAMIGKSLDQYRKLSVYESKASISFTIQGKPGVVKNVLVQICYADASDRIHFTGPAPFTILLRYTSVGSFSRESDTLPDASNSSPQNDYNNDWLNEEETPRRPPNRERPIVKKPDRVLASAPYQVVDAMAVKVNLPAGLIVDNIIWAPDRYSFFALNENGIIYQVSVPDFNLMKEIHLEHNANQLRMSRQGLVVVMNKLQEIRVIDPLTFYYRSIIPVAKISSIATALNSDLAFATDLNNSQSLRIIDLKSGQVLQTLDAYQIQREQGKYVKRYPDSFDISSFYYPVMTEDGQYFFCVDGDALHRFKIEGSGISYEEIGPRLSIRRVPAISPDSLYISASSAYYRPKGQPDVGPGAYYIYKVTDLSQPILAFSLGNSDPPFGYDKLGKSLYSEDKNHDLLTMTMKGTLLKAYHLQDYGGTEIQQILVHPFGKKVLVLTQSMLFWIVFK